MIEGRKRGEKAKRYGKREAKEGVCWREGRERGVEDEADEVTG